MNPALLIIFAPGAPTLNTFLENIGSIEYVEHYIFSNIYNKLRGWYLTVLHARTLKLRNCPNH